MPGQTSLAERMQIVQGSAAGETAEQIAQRLGWCASTIRKWRRRGQVLGRAGLISPMGRPAAGAMSTFSPLLQAWLGQLRRNHPGWGPKTLRAELEQDSRWAGVALPSVAVIGRFLQAQGWTQRPEPHSSLPQSHPGAAGAAHAVWEMDARGYSQVAEVGVVTLINLNDRYSHVRLLSYPCRLGAQRASRHATTADYQAALRLAFLKWGLPLTLQVDHESVFVDNKSHSPFPTLLHQWLVALGVALTFGRVNQPTDQAISERSHQLWAAQVLCGQRFADWQALYAALGQRRDFLNHHLPCRSLANRPPLVAYPEAHHSGRPYSLGGESELLDLPRLSTYLAQGRWFRLVGANGTLSLASQTYYVGLAWRQHQLEITFDPATRCLCFADEAGQPIQQAPLQGVSVPALMGEGEALTNLPAFQLALPFTWPEQRLIRLYETAT